MFKFIRGNWPIVIVSIILTVTCVWLIRVDYFSYSVELNSLVPTDTKLSANLNMSELNTTINQKSKLVKNNIIASILDGIYNNLTNALTKYNIAWSDNLINSLEPEITYYITSKSNEWGILAKAQNKKLLSKLQTSGDLIISMTFDNTNIYKLTTKNEIAIYFSFINNNIISVSSSEKLVKDTLNNYINHTDTSWQNRFSIINLKPILTIKIDPQAQPESFDNDLLANLYGILGPVIYQSKTDLTIEFDQSGNYLTWQISNIETGSFDFIYNQNDISDNLYYINFKPSLLIGTYNPKQLNNKSAQTNPLWLALTKLVNVKTGTNLISSITNHLMGSILIAIKDTDVFFTIINEVDLEITKGIIYEILAKQAPQSITRILPDGTIYNELIASESHIQERRSIVNNKEITTIFAPNGNYTFNYYQVGKKTIISTDYKALIDNIQQEDINPNQCLKNMSFAELFYINSNLNNKLLNSQNLDEFTVYDQSSAQNIVIRGCLKIN